MADPLANLLAESGGLTFNQAFANARARGETTFRWRDPKTKADAGRKASFCARMKGVVAKAKGPAERAKASLRRWKCS